MIAALLSVALVAQVATPPAPPAKPAHAEAEPLFQRGLKAYDAREFTRAIELFEAAYRLEPLPEILFDIAMAHRALGDCNRATASFDGFIAAVSQGDPLLPRARARRKELESCAPPQVIVDAKPVEVAAVAPPPPLPSPSATQTPVLLAPMTPPPASTGSGRSLLRSACIASVGGTAVLALGGALFGLEARSLQQDVQDATMWGPEEQRADARGRTLGDVATVLMFSAGVTSLAAVTACLLSR